MRVVALAIVLALAMGAPTGAQAPALPPASGTARPPIDGPPGNPAGWHWMRTCFPRCGCPDDYCPNPCPRMCWPAYPPYYVCVPAGESAASAPQSARGSLRGLSWWFVPTPRALREAIWCRP